MTTLPHRPYPKIPLEAPDRPLRGRDFVALEKVHGAQLQLATDGEEVAIGKRKAWLEPDEAFFGWQLLRAELSSAARRAWAALGDEAEGSVLRLYGELCGGAYPHPEVEPVPGLGPVQTGIWYAPGLRFLVFDALLETAAGEALFLGWDELLTLCAAGGLQQVPLVCRGTRAEVIRAPVRAPSRVPSLFELPALADNIAEGLVLRSAQRMPVPARTALKAKIAEFDEQRFDGAAAFDPDSWVPLATLEALGGRMMNPPRLWSARSKVGVEPDLLREEMVLDVLIDLGALYPRRMGTLQEAEEETLSAALAEAAERVIQKG